MFTLSRSRAAPRSPPPAAHARRVVSQHARGVVESARRDAQPESNPSQLKTKHSLHRTKERSRSANETTKKENKYMLLGWEVFPSKIGQIKETKM